jgi:5-methylcytosine-specific restriction endonuclease McrA
LINLQLLCHACHVDKTKQEDKVFGWGEAGLARGRATHKKRSLKNQEKGEIA